jgi:hypothetical protein
MWTWTAIKNIHGPEIIALFGFVSVAVMSGLQGYWVIALIVAAVGMIFIILSAKNSYRQRSTELVDKYEERFFERMKLERKWAAKYLLEESKKASDRDCLEYVLDFLQAPIAEKVISGILIEKQVYDYFHHWIIMYYQASQEYIENYRKNQPSSWCYLKQLYDKILIIEKMEKERELGRKCDPKELIYSPVELKNYLEQEARIKMVDN